jgi:iron complex outermembrane receptor protein
VVTRDVLDAQAATTLMDALRNTAGVTHSQISGSTYDNITARGITVDNRQNYRLNGSLPIINLVHTPLENKERVEVLKGAAALHYGFVPPSGIVNLVTKRAGKDPLTEVTVMANDHGGILTHLDVARRFGTDEEFGARVNLVKAWEDNGIDNSSGDRMLAATALDWRATRDLSFKLDVEHYRREISEQAAIKFVPALGVPPTPDNSLNLAGEWQKYDGEATNVLFRTDYALTNNWAVLLEAGRARTERDRNFSSFTPASLATGEGTLNIGFVEGQKWINENYRAEINGTLSGDWISHYLTFGYTTNTRDDRSPLYQGVNVAQNLYDPRPIAPQVSPGFNRLIEGTIEDRGWYISDRISFGPQWQLTAGVRGSEYESRSTSTNASGVTTSSSYTTDNTSPAFALTYKPNPNMSVYASYVEGLEETGKAPAGTTNEGEHLSPAVSKQKEVGVKAEVASGVLVQAAYFDIKRPSATTINNRYVLNGLAQFKGVELSASGELTPQLSLIASALFLDAEQLNAADPDTFGKRPDNTPRRTASLFAEYRLRDVPGLALNGGLFHVGSRPVNDKNEAFVDGYTTLSLGGRYTTRIAGNNTVFGVVVDNVTDKDYWSTADNNFLGLGSPRTVKLTATMAF